MTLSDGGDWLGTLTQAPAPRRSTNGKPPAEYISRLLAIKAAAFDPYWDAGSGMIAHFTLGSGTGTQKFTDSNATYLAIVAMMSHYDAVHGTSTMTATDKSRAVTLAAKFVSSPAYTNNTWTSQMDGSGQFHSYYAFVGSTAVYWAYKYRSDIGWVNSSQVAEALAILTVNRSMTGAAGGVYGPDPTTTNTLLSNFTLSGTTNAADLQDLLGWQHNRKCLAVDLGVTPSDFATAYKYAIDTVFTRAYNASIPGYTKAGLMKDWGWTYTDDPSFDMSAFSSYTYGVAAAYMGSLLYPEAASALSLSATQINKLKAWHRAVRGQGSFGGHPNWMDVWSNGRMFNFSTVSKEPIGFLVTTMRNAGLLNMGRNDHNIARGQMDRWLDWLAACDTFTGDAADSMFLPYPWVPNFGEAAGTTYSANKPPYQIWAAYAIALFLNYGCYNVTPNTPTNVFTWHWNKKDLYVATPSYTASVLPSAPKVGASYGGADPGDHSDAVQLQHWGPSHVQSAKPPFQWMTAFGGYGEGRAPCFRVTRAGSTELDTSVSVPTSQSVTVDGAALSPTDYDTSTIPTTFGTLVHSASGAGSNYSLTAQTTFSPQKWATVYTITRTGTAGAVQGILTLPAVSGATVKAHDGSTLTTIWNGTTASTKSAPTYIHQSWGSYGIVWAISYSGCTGTASMFGSIPTAVYSRESRRDRATLLTADAGSLAGSASVTVTGRITDGTDADAAIKAALP